MDFDLRRFEQCDPESEGSEAEFEELVDALVGLFLDSQEGQRRREDDPGVGFWATHLLSYGYNYPGATLPEMSVADVDEIVTELFPRKITLAEPEGADDVIPELTAFWEFLKREFHLPQADAVLEWLRDIEPDFPGIMNDPANFGMAKSMVTMGKAAGFDMSTREGLNAFMLAYNANLFVERPEAAQTPPPHFDAADRRRHARQRAKLREEKMAEAGRKKSRKRK